MQEAAVITQPILDAHGRALGHEVLFGGPAGASQLDSAVNTQGTAALLLSVFGGLGIDDLADTAPAWLSVARDFLLEFESPPVRPDRVVVQLKNLPVEDALAHKLGRMVRIGYTLALDGFDGRDSELLDLCAMVKVDVRGRSDEELAALLGRAGAAGAQAVACGIPDEPIAERCRALGFDGLQGAGVAPARLVRRRVAGVCSAASLDTLQLLTADPSSDADLARLIISDPGLALTLLRYIGTAYSAPPALGSVLEAVDLLGSRMVRRWASMVARSAPAHPRDELAAVALGRARACEAASGAMSAGERESYFTVGLLSVAGEVAGAPIEDVVAALPLAPDVRTALLARAGPKGERLAIVLRHEPTYIAA